MTKRNLFYFALGPIGAGLSGFLTMPVMAWYFSVEDVGRYSIMQVLVSLSLLLATLGLDQAYVREFHQIKDKNSLFLSVVIPGFFILFLMLVITIGCSEYLSDLFFSYTDYSKFFVLVLIAIILSFLTKFLSLILRMEEKGLAYSVGLVVPKVFLLASLLLFIVFEVPPTFLVLTQAYVCSLILYFMLSAFSSRLYLNRILKAEKDLSRLRGYFDYSFPLLLSGLAFWLLTAMDRFFLKLMSNLEELGVYSVAINFAGVAVVLQGVFSTIWVPNVFKWISNDIELEKVRLVINWVLISIFSLWSLVGVFSWIVPYFLPDTYSEVAFIMMACMTYPFLYALSEVAGIGIVIKKKTKFNFYAALIALVVNFIGNYCLIPNYGASGAASASAFSFLVYFLVRSEIGIRMWGSFNRTALYVPSVLFTLISIYFSIDQSHLMSWLFLFMFVSVFAVTLIFIYKNRPSKEGD